MNASLSPIKHSPPANTVGICMVMNEDMKRFKFAFHSILSFTDYPYMLTVVESQQTLSVRTYLRSIQKNHPINVLQHNEKLDTNKQFDLGFRYMFTNASVKFGCVVGTGVIVEPEWLSGLVARLMADEQLAAIHVLAPCRKENGIDVLAFRRDAYEALGGFTKDFSSRAKESRYKIEVAEHAIVHKMNGGKKHD